MGKTACFILKLVAAGLALAAFVCLIVGSWHDLCSAIDGVKCRLAGKAEYDDYNDEDLYL